MQSDVMMIGIPSLVGIIAGLLYKKKSRGLIVGLSVFSGLLLGFAAFVLFFHIFVEPDLVNRGQYIFVVIPAFILGGLAGLIVPIFIFRSRDIRAEKNNQTASPYSEQNP